MGMVTAAAASRTSATKNHSQRRLRGRGEDDGRCGAAVMLMVLGRSLTAEGAEGAEKNRQRKGESTTGAVQLLPFLACPCFFSAPSASSAVNLLQRWRPTAAD